MLKFLTKFFNWLFNGINKFFESIFSKEEMLPRSKTRHIALDIYTADGKDYDPKKIAALDREKVMLAYDNGIAMMQEIHEGMKVINTRATLLLGYLATIIATLAPLLIKGDIFIEGTLYIWLVLVAYSILIFVVAHFLTNPNLTASAHNAPKKIMTKEVFEYDMKMIKLFEADLLQKRIDINNDEQKRKAKYLKNAISAAFIIPIFFFLVYLIVDLLNGILAYYFCSVPFFTYDFCSVPS